MGGRAGPQPHERPDEPAEVVPHLGRAEAQGAPVVDRRVLRRLRTGAVAVSVPAPVIERRCQDAAPERRSPSPAVVLAAGDHAPPGGPTGPRLEALWEELQRGQRRALGARFVPAGTLGTP